jgi:hypothetical protein
MYSSRTKEGNWCEDAYGEHLVKTRLILPLSYETETSSKYSHKQIKASALSQTSMIDTAYDLKVKNKDGLSYNLLFDHGLSSDERFLSSRAIPEGTLHHQRINAARKEVKMASAYATQSRIASALVKQPGGITPAILLSDRTKAVSIPTCKRVFPISDAVPKGI